MTQTHSEQTARGEVELKACPNPWCNSTTAPLPCAGKRWGWRVSCACGVSTYRHDTEADAIAAWNDRPSLSPADNGARPLGADVPEHVWNEWGLGRSEFRPTPDAVRGEVEKLRAALQEVREIVHQFYVDWGGEPEDAVPLQLARMVCDGALALHPSPEAPIEGQDVEATDVGVTLADVQAAESYLYGYEANIIPFDTASLSEAFARHRLAALRAPIERKGEGKAIYEECAAIAERYTCSNCGSLAGDEGCCEDPSWESVPYESLPTAIRNAAGEKA